MIAAYVETRDRVIVEVSKPVAGSWPVTVADRAGNAVAIASNRHYKANAIEAQLAQPLDLGRNGYTVSVTGFAGKVGLTPRGILDDRDLFYDRDAVLGATYTAATTTFRVFAPTAREVNVVLYDAATGAAGRRVVALTRAAKGIWETQVTGDLAGKFYAYSLTGTGFAPKRDVVDIYAFNAVDSSRRARITDLTTTGKVPPGPRVVAPQDMVVYEMHVRDFTIAPNSPAKPAERGQYLGFIAGIPRLQELGVTHVQLLPIQDFENNEHATNYNWGYVTSVFNSLLPRYYYRLDKNGGYLNGSSCGNDFRTEAPMARKYIIETMKFWVQEYGIDGFRFDLMALLDLDTMLELERELRAIRPDIILYGEPWAAGPSTAKVPTNKQTISGTRIGAFNDAMRNAIIGSPFDKAHGGFVQDGGHREQLQRAIQGQWRDWGDGPQQVVQYISYHDNYVIYDKLQLSKPGATHAERIEMMKLG